MLLRFGSCTLAQCDLWILLGGNRLETVLGIHPKLSHIVADWRRFSIGLWRVPEGDIGAACCADTFNRVKLTVRGRQAVRQALGERPLESASN